MGAARELRGNILQACAGGLRVGLLPLKSFGFLVAGGLGGTLGACMSPPGGSGARRTGWRGEKVPWQMLGRDDGSEKWKEEDREAQEIQ